MPNLDSVLKSRNITLPTKVCIVKSTVFPVVTCGCESWTIKKAECQRIDAFESWCWRRLLRVTWTERRSIQSISREINPEYSLEGLMCILVTWCDQRLIGKIHVAGKDWGQKEKRASEDEMSSPMQWRWTWASFGRWWGTGKPGMLQSMGYKEADMTGWLNNNNVL